jgi:hypothetical protein
MNGINKYVRLCVLYNTKTNKEMGDLQKKLEDLKEALKNKSISVNEYSSFYYQTYQQIKKLK